MLYSTTAFNLSSPQMWQLLSKAGLLLPSGWCTMLSSSQGSHQSTQYAFAPQAEEDSKKRKAMGQAVSSPVGATAARDKRRSPDPAEALLIPLADTPQQPLAALPSMLHPGAHALAKDAPSQAVRSGGGGQSHAERPQSAAGSVARCGFCTCCFTGGQGFSWNLQISSTA